MKKEVYQNVMQHYYFFWKWYCNEKLDIKKAPELLQGL